MWTPQGQSRAPSSSSLVQPRISQQTLNSHGGSSLPDRRLYGKPRFSHSRGMTVVIDLVVIKQSATNNIGFYVEPWFNGCPLGRAAEAQTGLDVFGCKCVKTCWQFFFGCCAPSNR